MYFSPSLFDLSVSSYFFIFCIVFLDGLDLSAALFCYSGGQSVCLKWMCGRCDRIFVANIIELMSIIVPNCLRCFYFSFLATFLIIFFYKSNISFVTHYIYLFLKTNLVVILDSPIYLFNPNLPSNNTVPLHVRRECLTMVSQIHCAIYFIST